MQRPVAQSGEPNRRRQDRASSYPELLEVLLDPRRQDGRLGVELRELRVDLAHRRREVEVRVLLLGSDADVAAGRQAPVVGLYFGAVDELDQPLHIPQLAVGEALGEPVSLPPEVAHLAKLFDGSAPRLVGCLAGAGDVAAVPGVTGRGVALLLAGLDQPGRGLVELIGLLGKVAAGFHQRGEPVHQGAQRGAGEGGVVALRLCVADLQ